MSESTLSLSWTELQQEVGYFLGYGCTIENWSTAQATKVANYVHSGIRRVYYPPDANGYEWSFLRPTESLDITSDAADYDLPDDFGRLVGNLHYAADECKRPIRIIAVASVLDLRSRSDEQSVPYIAAIRYKSSTGATGQRQEILFYPKPDDSYTLSYSYEAYTGKLSDTVLYPLGGMHLSELYLESCLAVAEQRVDNEVGLHTRAWQALLQDAIARDRKKGAQLYGPMGHQKSTTARIRHGDTGSTYPLTYKGLPI